MITKYIKGDITETELKYIAHGVNAQNKMGSGVAKALFTKYPEVKEKYHENTEWSLYTAKYSNNELLGEYHIVPILNEGKYVFNLYTQEYYGYDGKKYVSYDAIYDCFEKLSELSWLSGPIAIPKIGAGLAGGDWEVISKIINKVTGDKLEIWVYEI